MNMKSTKTILSLLAMAALFPQSGLAMDLGVSPSSQNSMPPLQALGREDISQTVLVTAKHILTRADRERFYAMGVETILYTGDLSYYFYLPESLVHKISADAGVTTVSQIDPSKRMEKESSGALSVLSDDDSIDVHVLFLKEMDRNEIDALLQRAGIEGSIMKVTPSLRSARIRLTIRDYKKLSHQPLVQYMDKIETLLATESVKLPLETRNLKTAKQSDVTSLWAEPYNLNGRNMRVGIVDGGSARTSHQEFGGRVHDRTGSGEVNMHSTHVAGTIGAAGVNPKARGMAKEADLYSYSFTEDAFSDAVLNMYQRDGILFSNHSYGYSPKERLGEYDSVAATQDMTVANNPFLNIFEAAGNDGIDSSYSEYGIIKGPANSKNILTIGALDSMSDDVAELSSTGPVRDGRIKPDLCVRGEYVTSASSESDSSYVMMSGTSMATPAAAGMGTLVAEAYKRVTGGYDIRHDTLKAVLVNTAKDVANPGPDYKAGFGLIDAKAAVDTILTISAKNPKVNTSTIAHNATNTYRFSLESGADFKTTIAWIDPAADPSHLETLVNDIDMVLVNTESGKKYYPYTLDSTHPAALAVQNGPNHVDNIEQIEVKNLPAGTYELQVKGEKIVTDTQEYTIASSLPIFSTSNIETLKPSKIENFARKIFLATF